MFALNFCREMALIINCLSIMCKDVTNTIEFRAWEVICGRCLRKQ